MHYDGENLLYRSGGTKYWDWVDTDKMSMLDLDDMLAEMGHPLHGLGWYWRVTRDPLRLPNLKVLKHDNHLLEMGQLINKKSRVVDAYLLDHNYVEQLSERVGGGQPEYETSQMAKSVQSEGQRSRVRRDRVKDFEEEGGDSLEDTDSDDASFIDSENDLDDKEDDLVFDQYIEDEFRAGRLGGHSEINDEDSDSEYMDPDNLHHLVEEGEEDEVQYPQFNVEANMKTLYSSYHRHSSHFWSLRRLFDIMLSRIKGI
ncbi:unnamed protein product [Linum trigynum]|uniref:PB1-like domain-containing protein n=1 Tax=Linum trigynum TaxID=586398 RepID=A0AAV2FUZ8_9ROSI